MAERQKQQAERRAERQTVSLRDESSGEGCRGSIAMAERVVGSTALSAKGRVRVSKHSAEELARLGRDDGVDSGSEASGRSSGEEDDEVPAQQRARRESRPIVPRASVRSDPLANVGSVR